MRTRSEQQFLDWAKKLGIGVDEHYPRVAILRFRPETNEDRCWEVPSEPERRPYFLLSILELIGDWQSCQVWRHSGSWPSSEDPLRINDNVELQILAGLGMPLGTSEIVEFTRDELSKLVTLLFSTTIFGWSIGQDLYIVPDHGRCIVHTDHHDAIHLSFRHQVDREKFVEGMTAREFVPPYDLADDGSE